MTNKTHITDKKWFGDRPDRTYRLRKPTPLESKQWALGCSHVMVHKMVNTGAFARVPIDLSYTCPECVAHVEGIADVFKDEVLDQNICDMILDILFRRQQRIIVQSISAMNYHEQHCKPPKPTKPRR